jgi:hypothetical protein
VAEKNQYNSQPELSTVGVGGEGKGGAFSAALKICFKKHAYIIIKSTLKIAFLLQTPEINKFC